MARKTVLIGSLLLVVLNSTGLPAQDNGCTKRIIAVGVVDRQWNLVQGLSATSFRGKLRGREVQILSAVPDQNPRRVVVLIDASGSMLGAGEQWTAAKSISKSLIRFAPPRAVIAQAAFAETIIYSAGFEDDQTALLKSLDSLLKECERPDRTPGRTALYDAISKAAGVLDISKVGDTIIALTDAGDNKSRTEPKKLQEGLIRSGVRLFGVVIGLDLSIRARTPEEDSADFDSMVRTTGGNKLTLRLGRSPTTEPYIDGKTNEGSVNLALLRLYAQMGEFYRLDVKLPEEIEKPTKWKLEVVDASGKPMRGVEVHYPQELMPCARASP